MARTLEEAEARIKELEEEKAELARELADARESADYWRGEYDSVVR